jgi:hypothetical protein
MTLSPESDPTHRLAGPNSDYANPKGSTLGDADIGGGITYVNHHEDLSNEQFRMGEIKYTAFGGVKVLSMIVSGQITKSLYDGTLPANAFGDRSLQLPGVTPIVQGLPDTTWNAKVSLFSILTVRPYVSYTHTTFQLHQPTSDAFSVGATAGLDVIGLKGAYTFYNPGGGQSVQHYLTAGFTLNF